MNEPVTLDIGHSLSVNLFGKETQGAPHILAFHGGGGVDGSPAMMTPFAQLLSAEAGAQVSVAKYRTLNRDKADFEQMRADAAHALAWAHSQTPQGGQLFVLGASFGGLLALDAVLTAPAPVQDAVTGLILLNPVTDTGAGGFANRVISPEAHAPLSPLQRMADHPLLSRLRCLMAHGGRDEVVPIETSRQFAALWPKDHCEMLEFPNSVHGFFNRSPHCDTVAASVRTFVGVAPLSAPSKPPKRKPPLQIPKPPIEGTNLLPNGATMLYGVGAQKAGTSWLFDCLRQSPACHTLPTKELHYFDVLYAASEAGHLKDRVAQLRRTVDSLTDSSDPDNRARLRRIQILTDRLSIHAAKPGNHRPYVKHMLNGYKKQKFICDFTPSYSVLDTDGFKQMNSIGSAKFIFILRDPVARMWSQIRMAIATAHPKLEGPAFEAKCAAHAKDMHAVRDLSKIGRADYARTMSALEAAVPADQIHYAFYEELFSQTSVDAICAFLDIDAVPANTEEKVNLGRSGTLPADVGALLTERLMPQYTAAFERFGDAVPANWRKRVEAAPAPASAPQTILPSKLVRNTRRVVKLFGRKAPAPAAIGPTVAFLHIPKTAGQTVIKELAAVYPPDAFSPVRTHADAPEDAQMPPGYRLYAGHIDWVDLDTLPDDRFAFTILRDPRERIASFYFYLLREAAKLTPEELASTARTNMRMISTLSADDYFFGGDRGWQRFIQDHYNNFYCNYLITRKIRGWKDVCDLDQTTLVARAETAATTLQGIYTTTSLDRLEDDMHSLLGVKLDLQTNYVNAGPNAGKAKRWSDLLTRFEQDSSAERLEKFAQADSLLMQNLGLSE